MTCVQTEDFSPSQIGVISTRMSAAITVSKIAGQSSRAQPCSVMSGRTPVAISWSIARQLDLDAGAAHDRHREIREPLGVGGLGRALERAVDEDGPRSEKS